MNRVPHKLCLKFDAHSEMKIKHLTSKKERYIKRKM